MGDTPNSNKRQRLMAPEDEQSADVAIAGSSNEQSSPKLFKLTVDCFDEIFEYLSVKDLHSLGQTCKTMQQVAGVYFLHNYSAVEKFCERDGIYTVYTSRNGVVNERIQISGFNQFMPRILDRREPCRLLGYDEAGSLRYLQSHIDEFESTNHICLEYHRIDQDKVGLIKKLLPKIETIQVRNCLLKTNFYELMLKYCKNLKHIYVQNTETSFKGQNEWLLQEYPMLEHLELIPEFSRNIIELDAFFERNPKVQNFTIIGSFLWANRHRFLQSKIKLDTLKTNDFNRYDGSGTIKSIWDLLNQLHKQGFYKRLYFYTEYVDQDFSIQLTSLSGLETLEIRCFKESYSLRFLVNLKELILLNGLNVTDAKILANDLVKLERLYVDKTTIEDISPFIRYSPKLNKMKIFLKDKKESACNWKILNLVALNKEREKLPKARKITFYVRDDIFLATKWATKNGETNLSHIEMKRPDSYQWGPYF